MAVEGVAVVPLWGAALQGQPPGLRWVGASFEQQQHKPPGR